MIRPQMFSRSIDLAGQVVFANDTGYGGISPKSWTVPPEVFFISAVVVGAFNDGYASIGRGATTLLDTLSSIPSQADGGGNGGAPGSRSGRGPAGEAGAGGAGGYSSNGGGGGSTEGNPYGNPLPGSYYGNPGGSGAGGGGGGGGGGSAGGGGINGIGGSGGSVGLRGTGVSGAGGAAGTGSTEITRSGGGGGTGSPTATHLYGAGYVSMDFGSSSGGNLRYKNNIPVTPGEVLTISASNPEMGGYSHSVGVASIFGAGIRIMWGGGRSYPSNAGDI